MMKLIWLSIASILFAANSYAANTFGEWAPFGNVHWKNPVASVGALPATGNSVGDVRTELTAYGAYIWNGSSWTALAGGGGSVAWGSITGTLSSQTDLNTALGGKQATLTPSAAAILATSPISEGSNFNVTSANTVFKLTANGLTATLPAANTYANGQYACFVDYSGNLESSPLIIARTGSDTIGTLSKSKKYFTNFGTLCLASDGVSDWYKIYGSSNLTKQTFNSSTTWPQQAFVTSVTICGRGGANGGFAGGGSGGGSKTAPAGGSAGGCPGASVETRCKVITLTPGGADITVTIGAGGAGGTAPSACAASASGCSGSQGGNGGRGTASSFGALASFFPPYVGGGQGGNPGTLLSGGSGPGCIASNGNAGELSLPATGGPGGNPGIAGTANVNQNGAVSFMGDRGAPGTPGTSGTGLGGGGGVAAANTGADSSAPTQSANGGNGSGANTVGLVGGSGVTGTNGLGGGGGGGSGGSGQGLYTYTVTSANATAGATYTAPNSTTFTVFATIAGSTTLQTTGTGDPTAGPSTLTKATGTGDATISYSAFAATGTPGQTGTPGGSGSGGQITMTWSE